MKERLEAAEMWFIRRMWKIPWTAKLTNAEVLEKAGTSRGLIKSLINRQAKFFGHVMRKGDLEHLAFTAKIEGNRARGRQRRTYAESLGGFLGLQSMDMIRMTTNKKCWRTVIANVRI